MPDIINAATKSHPVRLVLQNISIDTLEHLVGFVTPDSFIDWRGGDTLSLEGLNKKITVAA